MATDQFVPDEGEFVDRRLKELILDRYEDVTDVRRETRMMVDEGELSSRRRLQYIGDYVRDFIRSFDQLMRTGGMPEGEATWERYPVGAGFVEVPPPWDVLNHVERILTDSPQPKRVEMKGLQSIINRPTPGAEWTLQVRAPELPHDPRIVDAGRRNRIRREITVRNQVPIPESMLMDAMSMATSFLDEVGIGFDKDRQREFSNYSTEWKRSLLRENWAKKVKRGKPDDFVIVVTASSRTGVSGTGKTTLQTQLAENTDLTETGFDAGETASLDAGELAYDITPTATPRSALVWDEAQGTPDTQGLDSRRAMKDEVIDSLNAILANRNDNYTIIIGAQQFRTLDPRLYPIVDAWLLIRKGPEQPKGPQGTYYRVEVNDYDLNSADINTPAVEDFTWEALDGNENYHVLENLKQQAKSGEYSDDDDESGELEVEKQALIAKSLKDEMDVSWRKVVDYDDRLTKSGSHLNRIYNDIMEDRLE